jgi:hypothetical protein
MIVNNELERIWKEPEGTQPRFKPASPVSKNKITLQQQGITAIKILTQWQAGLYFKESS